MSVSLEIGKVVGGIIPIGLIEDEVLENLRAESKGKVRKVIFAE